MEKRAINEEETLENLRSKYRSGRLSIDRALELCKKYEIQIDKDEFIKG